jgi:hypothetical protein
MQIVNLEVDKMDALLSRVDEDIRLRRLDIANAQKAQENRKHQIDRLSNLSQPVELDHTFFFLNRRPMKSLQERSSNKTNIPLKMYHLQSGDTVVLEGRLDEVTSFLHKRFKKLEDELATVKIHPDENIEMHEINQKQFREISENLTKLEKYDRQIYANILDIFRLRLYMIRLQREEAEDRELLTNDYELYNQKSKKALDEFNITIKNLQKQFEYDLTRCKSMYNRQINESKERLNKLNSSEIEKNIEKEIEKLYKKLHLCKKR